MKKLGQTKAKFWATRDVAIRCFNFSKTRIDRVDSVSEVMPKCMFNSQKQVGKWKQRERKRERERERERIFFNLYELYEFIDIEL